MIKCDNCEKWLDLQSDAVCLDEGTLCVECFVEWYGEEVLIDVKLPRIPLKTQTMKAKFVRENKVSRRDIAEMYRISDRTVGDIHRRKSWKHI